MTLTTPNPFGDCRCVDLADAIRAQFQGVDIPPCPTHEPEAHAARQADQAKASAEADLTKLQDTLGGPETAPPPETDPMVLGLSRAVARTSMPLNSSADAFAQVIGLPDAGHNA